MVDAAQAISDAATKSLDYVPGATFVGMLYAADQTRAVAPDEAELRVQTHDCVEVFVPGHGWWAPSTPPTIRRSASCMARSGTGGTTRTSCR
ncbi:MAG TPA: hypothetical protein VFV13_12020 [Acidimicrobiia bacterium]|nr:hypothetical protein [Acidimicrobiia bacterium]